jgi:hypothetical protein
MDTKKRRAGGGAGATRANPPLTATVYAGLTERGREQLGAKLAEAFGAYTDARGSRSCLANMRLLRLSPCRD